MYSLIGIIAILLIIVILFQLAKASELLSGIDGEEVKHSGTDNNNKLQGSLFMGTLIFGMLAIAWSTLHYAPEFLFLKPPVAEHSILIKSMYKWTLISIIPIFVLTHILLFGFAYKYSRDNTKLSFFYPENNKLELVWMLVPAVVMVFLVVTGIRNWTKITSQAPEEAMIIEATAQQFKWDIRYAGLDGDLGVKKVALMDADDTSEDFNPWGQDWNDEANNDDFFAADSILLPVDVPILVKINSLDVLHSFYLPEFNVKMDAVPGIPTQFWFKPLTTSEERKKELNDPEFIYELACTELCGKSHWNMRRKVYVVEQDEYDAWVKRQKPYLETVNEIKGVTAETSKKGNGIVGL